MKNNLINRSGNLDDGGTYAINEGDGGFAMSKNDGGAAFPHMAKAQYQELGGLVTEQITNNGMSLRDYFAAKAMHNLRMESPAYDYKLLAEQAYRYADAMLEARAK